MKIKAVALLTVGALMTACTPVEPPKTPAERHARISEAANLAFDRCGQFMMGGFSAASDLKQARDSQRQLAIRAGADATMFADQRKAITAAFDNQVIWTNQAQACNSLVTNIAREA